MRGWVGMGTDVAGTGGDGNSSKKKRAGTGRDGVLVDFAGREWGHILIPVQLSNLHLSTLEFLILPRRV